MFGGCLGRSLRTFGSAQAGVDLITRLQPENVLFHHKFNVSVMSSHELCCTYGAERCESLVRRSLVKIPEGMVLVEEERVDWIQKVNTFSVT